MNNLLLLLGLAAGYVYVTKPKTATKKTINDLYKKIDRQKAKEQSKKGDDASPKDNKNDPPVEVTN